MSAVAVTILAYALGCVATGYYVVRLVTGEDVRGLATGSTGARNVGRRLGVAAAVATFAADVAKGAVAVAVALAVAGAGAGAAALVAVTAGTSRRSSFGSGAAGASVRPPVASSFSTGASRPPHSVSRRSRRRRHGR
jgi:Glycerol-3-phosphate acyltransferase